MEPREQAKQLYQQSSGKIPLKEIAALIGVAEGTVRSWKKRDHWDDNGRNVATLQTDATQREKGRQQKRKARANQRAAAEIVENDTLNDTEKDFCLHFIHTPNRVQAAWMTGRYKTRDSARQGAFMMMQKPAVQAEIKRLKELKCAMMLSDTDDIVDYLERAAFTDLTSVIDFSRGGFKLKKGAELETSVIAEISKSKGGGLKVKRVDPLRAVELLCKIRGDFAPEKHQMGGEISVTSPLDEISRRIAGVAARLGTKSDTEDVQ